MDISLRRIREADLEKIMQWRMDPEITRYMNTNPKLTIERQLEWFSRIQGNEDVSYWMILVNGEKAGVINITGCTNPDGVLGWAYYIGEKKMRSIQTALSLEMSMYDYVFDALGKKAVYSDVFSLNSGVIKLHLICGAEIVEEKKACVIKENVPYDVVYMRMTIEKWYKIRNQKKYLKVIFTEE